jgi:hypothetical protein
VGTDPRQHLRGACAARSCRARRRPGLHLTPLELIDRIAALIPPPRTHRHRYFGVLAPNSLLRAAVTAMAAAPIHVAQCKQIHNTMPMRTTLHKAPHGRVMPVQPHPGQHPH